MRRLIPVLAAALFSAAFASPAHATTCDVPLAISAGGGQACVMILLDNSNSMNEALTPDAYNPATHYSGNFSAGTTYMVGSAGNYTPRSFNNHWPSTPSAHLITSDQGESAQYDGNYLNWIYFTATTVQRGAIPQVTRIQAAKQAVNTVLGTATNCLFGLEVFNFSDGGNIIDTIGTAVSKIQTDVNAIDATTWTPLAEASVTAMTYFQTTGGHAPIKADCQKAFLVIVTDGFPTQDLNIPNYLKGYDGDGLGAGNCTTLGTGYPNSDNCSNYIADVTSYMYRNDMRPDMADLQNVATFVIGFNITAPVLQEAADNGGGDFYRVDNLEGCTTALSNAFSTIEKRISAGSSVAVVSAENRTNNRLYRARYESQTWRGYVEAFSLPYHSGDAALWESGALLAARDPNTRTVLTSTTGANTVQFTTANAATLFTPLGLADATTASAIISYVRGTDASGYRDRGGWPLGDIVDSSPIVVGVPTGFNQPAGYSSFRTANASRQEALYVGANDGMLHCFSTADGSELWSYIPKTLLSKLPDLASTAYCHEYFVNLTPVAYDVNTSGTTWRTIVFGGEERGGSGLFALDVTNPAANAVSVLWDLNLTALKGSWNTPTMVRDKTLNKQVLCMGTGYDTGSGTASLLAINPVTGAVSSTFSLGSAYAGNKATRAVTLDLDYDGYDDLLYLGDLAGRVWRVNLKTNPWTITLLFNCGKPIQAPPVVTVDSSNRPMLFFGTGEYLTASDLTNTTTQTIYGIIDDGTGTTLTTANLVDQSTSFHSLTAASRGWYMNITQATGERITRVPALIAGTLYIPSFAPNTSACSGGGQSWLYSLDYKDGSAPDNANGTANNVTTGRVESVGDGIMADPSVDLVNEKLILQSSNAVLLTHNITAGLQKLIVRSWHQKWN